MRRYDENPVGKAYVDVGVCPTAYGFSPSAASVGIWDASVRLTLTPSAFAAFSALGSGSAVMGAMEIEWDADNAPFEDSVTQRLLREIAKARPKNWKSLVDADFAVFCPPPIPEPPPKRVESDDDGGWGGGLYGSMNDD